MSKTQGTHGISALFGVWATSLWQRLTVRQIKWRLTLAYVSIIYLSMTAVGLYLSYSVEKQYTFELRNVLHSHARLTRNLIEDEIHHNGLPGNYDRICSDIGKKIHARVQILDNEKRILGDSDHLYTKTDRLISTERSDKQRLLGSFGCRVCHPEVRSSQSIDATEPLVFRGHMIGNAKVSTPMFGVKQASARIRRLIFVTLVIAAGLAALLSQRLAANIANPISKMNVMARKMADGDLNQRVSVNPDGEVGELASSFNIMASQLQIMMNQMSEDKAKMETILATMADGIIMTDENTRILLFNKSSERIFNRKESDVTGTEIQKAELHPEIGSLVAETLASGGLVRREIRIPSTPETVVSIYCLPVRDGASNIKGIVLVLHDLTEIRKHEKAQKDFVANVSHELRTPITAIRATAEALVSGAKNEPKLLDRFLTSLVSESERLSLLIDDLLEIARREADRIKTSRTDVNMSETVEKILGLYTTDARRNNLSIVTDIPADLAVYADERQVEQVMQNLIDNAIKYTPENGQVTVRAENNKDWTTISVSDTGIGIPQNDVGRIFERFYRVDKARSRQMGGTGLGLSIVKEIVESHGGSISVKTRLGEGSTFAVKLPTRLYLDRIKPQ